MDEFMLKFARLNGYDSWSDMYEKLNGCELHQKYRQCFQDYISKLHQPSVSGRSEQLSCGCKPKEQTMITFTKEGDYCGN